MVIANSQEEINMGIMSLTKYKVRNITLLVCIVAYVIVLSSCDRRKPTNTSTSGIISIVCDESFENILSQEIDVFEFTYPKANIIPYYTDENSAIDSLMQNKTKLIITAHMLTDAQVEYLKEQRGNVKTQKIAVDAIALIVNKDNPIEELTMSELGEIMTGKVTKWNEISPSKLGTIQVVFDNQGSSTVQYMRDSLLHGSPFTPNVFAQKSNADVFKAVETRKDAIGVIGVSWISSDLKSKTVSLEEKVKTLSENDTTTTEFDNSVKVLKVRKDDLLNGYKPYQAYIYDGSYPLFRGIYAITTAAGGSLGHGFFSFITGFTGQKIIQRTGVLPAVIQPRMVSVN